MGRAIDDVITTLPAEQQAEVARRAQALVAEELSLRELRQTLELTQGELGRRLHKGQEEVSRIEQRLDLRLSTLQSYIESLGGELELLCRFRGRVPVRLRLTRGGPSRGRAERTPSAADRLIDSYHDAIAQLCRRYGVRRLTIFGSALRADFNPRSSDIDLAVEFGRDAGGSPAHQYFDLKTELERLFERSVDLVELSAMPDTRLKRLIERTQLPVYVEAA